MRAIAVWLVVAGAAACSPARAPSPESPAPDLEAIYRARADSARRRHTPADVRFMTGMIAHHQQALEMAALVPRNGASSSIETLAARIINAQRDEIATLEQWLRERSLPLPAGEGHQHEHVPGMLTPAQMQELAVARGPAFDRLFLRYMIQHHRGAVAMVHELFATDGAAQDEVVFKLASDIQVDQITEIARMELLLQEMNPS